MDAMGGDSILFHVGFRLVLCYWLSQPHSSAEAETYLCILHQIISTLEPVVKLRHPPGGDDLEAGQRGQDLGKESPSVSLRLNHGE